MKKTLPTLRYLSRGFAGLTAIGFLSIVGSIAITDLIYYLTDRYNSVHTSVTLTAPLEFTAGMFALLTGLLLFIANFKVMLANGISRKTFLLANILAAVGAAAALSIFNFVVVLATGLFQPVILISHLIYPYSGWAGLLILQFALYFWLIVLGWFITLAYYRSSKPVQWALSLAPFVLFFLLQQDNSRGGAITNPIREFLSVSMLTPFRATTSMLAYAAILCGLVYLLIRRAPLKN